MKMKLVNGKQRGWICAFCGKKYEEEVSPDDIVVCKKCGVKQKVNI